jgi:hypothetical protein
MRILLQRILTRQGRTFGGGSYQIPKPETFGPFHYSRKGFPNGCFGWYSCIGRRR